MEETWSYKIDGAGRPAMDVNGCMHACAWKLSKVALALAIARHGSRTAPAYMQNDGKDQDHTIAKIFRSRRIGNSKLIRVCTRPVYICIKYILKTKRINEKKSHVQGYVQCAHLKFNIKYSIILASKFTFLHRTHNMSVFAETTL
jgi:hypothetical protein